MSESNLTKEIKIALRSYSPIMKSSKRTIRWAEEVDVGAGYVDSIRFEDYIESTIAEGRYNIRKLGIAVTCFEIKISKSDFRSRNGHNFVGNFNYYVVPKEIYSEIRNLVPADIGIIIYYGHGSLIRKKKCEFKEVDKSDLNRFLFNALKKWVDSSHLQCSSGEIY